MKLFLRWLLKATISFDVATFFLPFRAISKCALSPCGPCSNRQTRGEEIEKCLDGGLEPTYYFSIFT